MKKYFEVSYEKKVGGRTTIIVYTKDKAAALASAKAVRHTGKNFKVLKEVPKGKRAKASGSRM